jgi:hypothetical protein
MKIKFLPNSRFNGFAKDFIETPPKTPPLEIDYESR